MKAAYLEEYGSPEVLKYGDVPDPVPGAEDVLVDIHAASVNAADWKVRLGNYRPANEFPHILGRDFSGVISATGKNVEDLNVGEAIFGVCDVGQEGAYAEKIAVKASIIATKPDQLSHIDAAALALAGLTAVVSIEDTLMLQSGEKILIQGGAGGGASFGIQLAKHIGAHVITTASASNHQFVASLGADEIIDYNTHDFSEIVSDCDAVFDTVGGSVVEGSFAVLKSGGRAAFIASGIQAPESPRDDVQSLRPKVGRDRPHLERIIELVEVGAVKAPDISLFSLSAAADAHRISETRHLRGKLVFEVR